MEQKEKRPSSVAQTPSSLAVPLGSRSYRQSYRSCLGAASRLCPFTPGASARKLNTSRRPPTARNINEQVEPEHLALLTKAEWHLSYVTPLFQFRHTQLKTYGQQLSAFISGEQQKGLAMEVEGSHSFKVNLSLVQGLVERQEEPETVLVQIVSKPMFSPPEEHERPVWSGWFSCVNGSLNYLASLPQGFVCLPLLCTSGPETLTSLVKAWFQRTFDCCIAPLGIDQTTLKWLAVLWTNCQPEAELQNLKMLWTIPVEPPLDITYEVDSQDAWKLWSCIRKEKGKEGEEETIDILEVVEFFQELKTHFYRHFRLDLSAGNIKQVATALGSCKSNGRIKISNSRYIITTLSLLTECALLKMPI